MATSRFSLTLFCPMNSFNRCGRSLSSKEESSATGAADTSRSFEGRCNARLSLAADTASDVSSSEVQGVERTLLSAAVELDFELDVAVDFALVVNFKFSLTTETGGQ